MTARTLKRPAPVVPREIKASKSRSSKLSILLVEDEPLLVSLYRSVLEKLTEAKVFTATEAQEALALVQRELPRIVLLDLMIPTTKGAISQDYGFHEPVGFEVLRKVKANPKTKHIHVIIISNLDADEHKQRAHDLGAEDYIVKALLQPKELADRIAKYLES